MLILAQEGVTDIQTGHKDTERSDHFISLTHDLTDQIENENLKKKNPEY